MSGTGTSLCVSVGEKPSLQHLVRRKAYSLDDVHGIERRLFDFSEEVFRIAVELQDANVA